MLFKKQGTLQNLANFYQSKRDLNAYADYTGKENHFNKYVQTLLLFRFSLNWSEYELDLERWRPFISSELRSVFHRNNIEISENATIKKFKSNSNGQDSQWHIYSSVADVFLLNKRGSNLDIYKLLPQRHGAKHKSYPFHKDKKYQVPASFIKTLEENKIKMYNREKDDKMIVLLKKEDFIHAGIYDWQSSGTNNILAQINNFIADLGQLLFTANTLWFE